MLQRPTRSKRTDTLFAYPTLVRSQGRKRRERRHPQIRLIEGPEPAVEGEAEAIDEARDIKGGVELKAVGARGAVPNDVHEEQAAIGGSLHIVGGVTNIEHLAPLPALLRQDMRGGIGARLVRHPVLPAKSEEHTSELQSLMRISYAVFCLKKKKKHKN